MYDEGGEGGGVGGGGVVKLTPPPEKTTLKKPSLIRVKTPTIQKPDAESVSKILSPAIWGRKL